VKSLRVVHVGKFYPPARGGMEQVIQVLAEGERASVDTRVLVANSGHRTIHEQVNGIPVTRAATARQVGSVSVCPTLPWWMRRIDTDLMVVHEPNPAAIVAHAIARPAAPLVFWVHAEVVRPAWRYNTFYRPFLRRMLARADRIVVTSPPMIDVAAELQPFRDKCVAIPLAVDPDQHRVTPALEPRIAAWRQGDGAPLVAFVGRLVPYKGIDVMLHALSRVDGVRAVIVGDGPLKPSLETLSRQLGLDQRVTFAGNVGPDELTAVYNACDLLVLPSVTRAEAFGVVQLEAMSCGKPVICTDLPSGVPWVNQHGVTGLVVPPREPEPLADAIRTLAGDVDARRRMGAAARARVVDQFSIERMVRQTTSLYHEVAAEHAMATDRAPDLHVRTRPS
jgi:rhamnosyl/mannosyltransferase